MSDDALDMDELRKELGEVLHSTLHAALVDGVWSVFNRMEKEILSLQSQLGDAEEFYKLLGKMRRAR